VAYFTLGKPVKGDSQFGHTWKGATWLFSSKEHLDLFAAAPEKYAPQYGGY
jgi:YHS domain-containing protein